MWSGVFHLISGTQGSGTSQDSVECMPLSRWRWLAVTRATNTKHSSQHGHEVADVMLAVACVVWHSLPDSARGVASRRFSMRGAARRTVRCHSPYTGGALR